MNFTDLEYVLMISLVIMLILLRVANRKTDHYQHLLLLQEIRSNKYADWLIQVAKGTGKVVRINNTWEFRELIDDSAP